MTDRRGISNRDGRQAPFEQLYAAHHRAILAYCARRCPRWDAWDAAAEVFVVAWRRIDEVPPAGEVRAWLIGVAFRVLSNQRRSASRRARLFERVSRDRAWAPMPDEQLLRNEEDREVIEALSRLSRTDREIVQLTLWEELSPSQIADVLGISRDAVDQRFSRAKKRLARQLEGHRFMTRSATQPVAKEGGGP
jgi:RNA polymerase sigma-70 factor (ECF subfamily)